MAIKKYKPTSNGRRNMTSSDFAEITTNKPEKSLLGYAFIKSGTDSRYSIGVVLTTGKIIEYLSLQS